MGRIINDIKCDICAIECTADDCELICEAAEGRYARAEFTRSISVWLDKASGKLVIKQRRGLLAKLFGSEASVKIYVPGHMVPSLTAGGHRVDCTLCGGIYGDVEITPDSGSLSAESAAMNDCNVRAHIFDAKFADCTIKSGLICEVDEGDIAIENTFATVVACKTKKGNIGAAGLSCKNTAFDTAEGNITATICGDESTFDVWVNAREGTCNRQSANIEGNSASFKAHSAKGNIFADFVPCKED